MKPVIRLVPDSLSADTVVCLGELFQMAQSKGVLGIAFTAILPGQKIIANTAGECRRNPTLTRGMVAALEDELRDMVHR